MELTENSKLIAEIRRKSKQYIVCKHGEYGIMSVDLSKMVESSVISEEIY